MAFEENGFLEPGMSWPPPDPDKMPSQRKLDEQDGAMFLGDAADGDEYIEAFKQRQQNDLRRRRFAPKIQGPAANCGGLPGEEDEDEEEVDLDREGSEKGWRNAEGESLGDYGVDDDEDVPLSELMARRKKR